MIADGAAGSNSLEWRLAKETAQTEILQRQKHLFKIIRNVGLVL